MKDVDAIIALVAAALPSVSARKGEGEGDVFLDFWVPDSVELDAVVQVLPGRKGGYEIGGPYEGGVATTPERAADLVVDQFRRLGIDELDVSK